MVRNGLCDRSTCLLQRFTALVSSDRTQQPVIGLVGGIGSGKSALARWLAARHNGMLINGDEVGHRVLTRPDIQKAIRNRFGNNVFDSNGQIDRRALGAMVFGRDDLQTSARRDLERIVHPRIREAIEKRIAESAALDKKWVLLDAAVLFEAGWNDLCRGIAFVDVPRTTRLKRLREERGWDEAELDRREASQISLPEKRRRADFVVDNSDSIDESGRQLETYLTQVLADIHS
jgi:dephospho-CoA kinase